jgi:VWFA-related protein
MRKIKLLFLSVTVFFVVIVAVAMAVPQLTPIAPTFQSRTRLVQVDVVVRNKSGPVMMLNQDDFTLLDNGKPQKISVFAVKGTPSSRQSAVPLPAGTVSNRVTRNGQEAASSTIILIDRLNTSPRDQRYASQKIVKFLENRRSQDRIGIYEFGNGIRAVQDLTDDPDRLSRAINRLKPQDANHRTLYTPGPLEHGSPEMSGRELEQFTMLTADERVSATKKALEAIAQHLAPVPGRKSLIWITGSFPLLLKTEHEYRDYAPDMKEAARALNDANVALYAVDARGLTAAGLLLPGIDTMNDLAGLTGGMAFYADNGIDSLIEESVEDSELIYTLGFYPSQESQNGDWRPARSGISRWSNCFTIPWTPPKSGCARRLSRIRLGPACINCAPPWTCMTCIWSIRTHAG